MGRSIWVKLTLAALAVLLVIAVLIHRERRVHEGQDLPPTKKTATRTESFGEGAYVVVPVGDCSGSLAIMEGMSQDQKALVLTCGHCTGEGTFSGRYPDDGQTFIEREVQGSVSIHPSSGPARSFAYGRLLLATMTGTDIAVFELNDTYHDVLATLPGVTPLTISRRPMTPGMKTRIVSANRHKALSCTVDSSVPTLKEGPWTWHDAIRFRHSRTECDFVHGLSGAAVIDTDSREIVGVAQTMFEGGPPCTLNNPCEIPSPGEVDVDPDTRHPYGARTSILYSCFDSRTARFDFQLAGCPFSKR